MKRYLMPALLIMLACLTGLVSAQTPEPTQIMRPTQSPMPTQTSTAAQMPEPTQTPYIIYVVVTATPEPDPAVQPIQIVQDTETPIINRVTEDPGITLVNPGSAAGTGQGGDGITIVNPGSASGEYAGTVDDLIQIVVATVMADPNAGAGAGNGSPAAGSGGGALVHLADGSSCTMSFTLLSEPTYPAGSLIPRGEVFWKEWLIQNTGTCTWTQDWEFVFDSGWQIGNTRFHMNRTTAPGETLNVRLAMVPDQKQDGNYYSTYIFEAPDGTRYGTITSSYTVKGASYFAKPTEKPRDNCKKPPCTPPWYEDPCWPPFFPWWW